MKHLSLVAVLALSYSLSLSPTTHAADTETSPAKNVALC